MDEIDKKIVNQLQTGFPVSERPYLEVATQLGIDENELIGRLKCLLDNKTLTRFGPMYNAEKLGGAFSLVAMKVPPNSFDHVAEIVNDYIEVAHNYQRDHEFNMWFVLATESTQRISEINNDIEQRTGIQTFNMPKLDEYFVGLKLEV